MKKEHKVIWWWVVGLFLLFLFIFFAISTKNINEQQVPHGFGEKTQYNAEILKEKFHLLLPIAIFLMILQTIFRTFRNI